MFYSELPKNLASDRLSPKKKIAASLWTTQPSDKKRLHWHDYFTLDIIVEGEGMHYINFDKRPVARGHMHLIMPSDIHDIMTEQSAKLYTICFREDSLPKNITGLLSAENRSAVLDEDELKLVLPIAEAMIFYQDEDIKKNLLEALLRVLGSHIKQSECSTSKGLQKVLNFIDINFRDNPSLAKAAEIASYTPSYFSHIFRQNTGCTYTEYLTNKKINYACALIQIENISLSDVATSSGFSTLNNFNYAFKSVMGTTPAKYREELKNKKQP